MRKTKTVPFEVAWMGPKIAMLSEVSQTEKDKCHLISLLSDGILKSGIYKWRCLQNWNGVQDVENEL